MPKLEEKLKKIQEVVFDGDGVFFTGRVFVGFSGEVMKERSLVDGQGISFLRAAGIRIAFCTGEDGRFFEPVVEKMNGLPSVTSGAWPRVHLFTDRHQSGKVEAVNIWLTECRIEWEQCAVMGDDFSDYGLFQKCSFRVAPEQAEKELREMADFVTPRVGGDGAIRDFANLILQAKGISKYSLAIK